ncbi:UNVERIFIED_CONTAM: hypothetical protein K2H54_061576 [Gekko kuhli]
MGRTVRTVLLSLEQLTGMVRWKGMVTSTGSHPASDGTPRTHTTNNTYIASKPQHATMWSSLTSTGTLDEPRDGEEKEEPVEPAQRDPEPIVLSEYYTLCVQADLMESGCTSVSKKGSLEGGNRTNLQNDSTF